MPRKSSGETELRWQGILDRQAASGLSIRQFCANAGISQPSFYAWRRKLQERAEVTVGSGKSRGRRDESNNGRAFIPLTLRHLESTLEVIHPLGYQVRMTGEVNGTALRHVLDVLDARGER